MRHKTSVTLDEDTVLGILELVRKSHFRNKSHVVEYAIKKLLDEVEDE